MYLVYQEVFILQLRVAPCLTVFGHWCKHWQLWFPSWEKKKCYYIVLIQVKSDYLVFCTVLVPTVHGSKQILKLFNDNSQNNNKKYDFGVYLHSEVYVCTLLYIKMCYITIKFTTKLCIYWTILSPCKNKQKSTGSVRKNVLHNTYIKLTESP